MSKLQIILLLVLKVFVLANLIRWLFGLNKISWAVIYTLVNLVSLLCFGYLTWVGESSTWTMTPFMGISRSLMLTFLLTDIVLGLFFIIDLIIHYFNILITTIVTREVDSFSASRRAFVKQFGVAIASVPFMSMFHAIFIGKYYFKVRKQELFFPDLPYEFDGLRIVQFSDFHAGSFDNIEKVKKGLKKINDLNPDLLVFTGDMINVFSSEVLPYKAALTKLKAKYGKISILGNHDYYGKEHYNKPDDLDLLKKYQREMGFNLLLNRKASISIGNDTINVIGVENWGSGPFTRYGDLDRAMIGTKSNDFNILLSHDPTHWENVVVRSKHKVDLTLSGHTHGMQFGIELPFLRWSPAQYIYKKWAGLYKEGQKYLYVNRGFGYLWFSGRVGIWPEITEFILRRK